MDEQTPTPMPILQQPEDEALLLRMRKRTFNGRPLGGDRFIAQLATMLNRRLRDPKMGRPRTDAGKRKKPGTRRWTAAK